LVEALEVVKSFLHEHQFIDQDFPIEGWIEPGPLAQAYHLEGLTASPSH
jgi:hypothetical protein